jgi:hypothetical protein
MNMADETKTQYDFESEIKEEDGKTSKVSLAIVRPSAADATEAGKHYSKAWAEALRVGNPLRAQVPLLLVEKGIWTDKDEKELNELSNELQHEGAKLEEGGLEFDKAVKLAEGLQVKRAKYMDLAMRKNSLDNQTVEGQAELARLNYLIFACTVYSYNVKKKFFDTFEKFQARSEEKVTGDATKAYMEFVYGVDYNYEKNYPENSFLIEYGFVNDKLQYLNDDGKPYDKDTGLLINDLGQWVDENNNRVNIKGQRIDKDGKLVDKKPFLNVPERRTQPQ